MNHDLELKHNKEEPKLAGKKNEEPQSDFFLRFEPTT